MGLLDFLGGSQPLQIDPSMMGLLGAAGAMSQAYAPQPASRLPLARPNAAYLLGQAAGGFGQGYGAGLTQQQIQAGTTGQNIKNLNDALSYNFWAPFLGQKPIQMGTPGGVSAPPGAMPQPGAGPDAGAASPPAAAPVAAGGFNPPAPISAPPGPGGGAPDMASLLTTIPPPILQRMGMQVPPELTAAFYAGIKPGSPEWQTIVKNVAVKASGAAPVVPGERAGIPDKVYNLATGNYDVAPGAYDTMARGAFTQSQAAAQGGLGAKEEESAFNAGLKVKTENEIAKRQSFYQTGVMPPDYGSSPAMPTGISPQGDIATPRGTVVPKPPAQGQFPGTDAIIKQNTNTAETEKNFGVIRPTLDQAENRLVGLAQALQIVESKGLNEGKAHASAVLHGAGFNDLADVVMSKNDLQAVQRAVGLQVFDVLSQLKVAIGPGQRLLNSEFTNTLDKQYGPDLQPAANFDLITRTLGGIYQTRNMINDYYSIAKPAGWRDANAYVSAYYDTPQNSLNNMIEYAGKAIGPLKGMAQSAAPQTRVIGGKTYTWQP